MAKVVRDLTAHEKTLTQSVSDEFGIDVEKVIFWLITYGPKVVEAIKKWFKKNDETVKLMKGVKAGHCPEHVKKEAAKQIERLTEALCAAICIEHCLNEHCE